MPRPLKSYHLAWLAAHPKRSEEWLRAHIADGFDVHHLDGNKTNDDARNLLLIEHDDHMRLHGMPFTELPKITGRMGGKRRAANMNATARKQSAQKAARTRWKWQHYPKGALTAIPAKAPSRARSKPQQATP